MPPHEAAGGFPERPSPDTRRWTASAHVGSVRHAAVRYPRPQKGGEVRPASASPSAIDLAYGRYYYWLVSPLGNKPALCARLRLPFLEWGDSFMVRTPFMAPVEPRLPEGPDPGLFVL